jgi:hypothetical protein
LGQKTASSYQIAGQWYAKICRTVSTLAVQQLSFTLAGNTTAMQNELLPKFAKPAEMKREASREMRQA